ncbi:MAG TPA: hypothetical protein VNZ47_05285 [Candidatus Dormibacteraeota bacterium]|nr:hypothetical protein [Candidatus Dormibacteraeota bacterium]
MAQQGPAKVVAQLPGTALRWIHAAEPVFAEQNLKVENYTVGVMDEGNTVTVSLSSNPTPNARGSTGKFPGYWVTFSKKTGKILKQAYTR